MKSLFFFGILNYFGLEKLAKSSRRIQIMHVYDLLYKGWMYVWIYMLNLDHSLFNLILIALITNQYTIEVRLYDFAAMLSFYFGMENEIVYEII